MKPSTKTRFDVLFILGLGRSGSTLLGMLLDNHPGVVGVGELFRMDQVIDNPASRCSCGLPLSECERWREVIRGVPESVQRNYKKWTPVFLNQVRENAGGELLVDVSKTRAYRVAKGWKDPRVGFVLLLRDPRGIFRSYVAERKELVSRLKMHKKWVRRLTTFARRHTERCVTMYYEDLVTNPEEAMSGLCDFAGLTYLPEMTSLGVSPHHLPTYSGSSFLKGKELRLDERWREEMDAGDIAKISSYLKRLPAYARYRLGEVA